MKSSIQNRYLCRNRHQETDNKDRYSTGSPTLVGTPPVQGKGGLLRGMTFNFEREISSGQCIRNPAV